MPWIADVIPNTTIRSATWGNLIRNATVLVYNTTSDRNSAPGLIDGMVCVVITGGPSLQLRTGGQWYEIFGPWNSFTPVVDTPGGSVGTWTLTGCMWRAAGYDAVDFRGQAVCSVASPPLITPSAFRISLPVAANGAYDCGMVRYDVTGHAPARGPWARIIDSTHFAIVDLTLNTYLGAGPAASGMPALPQVGDSIQWEINYRGVLSPV